MIATGKFSDTPLDILNSEHERKQRKVLAAPKVEFHGVFDAQPHRSYLYGLLFQTPSSKKFDYLSLLPEWLANKVYPTLTRCRCASARGSSPSKNIRDPLLRIHATGSAAICITAFAFAITSDNLVPAWFPYLGSYFYIAFVPLSIYAYLARRAKRGSNTMKELIRNNDSVLFRVAVTFALLCCLIGSPVLGIWATVAWPKSDLLLRIGAWLCAAFGIPLWILAFIEIGLSLKTSFKSKVAAVYWITVAFIIGTTVQQIVVGQLVWFPYLALIGLLLLTPPCCGIMTFVAVRACFRNRRVSDDVPGFSMIFAFIAATDINAAMLITLNFNHPTESLIQEGIIFKGAILFYVWALGLLLLLTSDVFKTTSKLCKEVFAMVPCSCCNVFESCCNTCRNSEE